MTRRLALAALLLALSLPAPCGAQTYTPQSGAALSVTFQIERLGGSRVLVFGEVRNAGAAPYERVVVLAEGLDDGGQVVSRGRAYVTATVPAHGHMPFEIRMLSAGRERRYRVGVDSYQLVAPGAQSP